MNKRDMIFKLLEIVKVCSLLIMFLTSFMLNAKEVLKEELVNHHTMVSQITEKNGFLLDFKRWSISYPDKWTIDSQTVPENNYISLDVVLSREFHLQHRRVKGGNIWYRISLHDLPKEYCNGDQIIEFEFPMEVTQVVIGGKALKDITKGNSGLYRRATKNGRNFLVNSVDAIPYLYVCVKDFAFRFDNHIGNIIIRHPNLMDQLYISKRLVDKPDKFEIICGINNRLNMPLIGTWVVDVQNYFGKSLRSKILDINIKAGGKAKWSRIEKKSADEYKLVAQFIDDNGRKSPKYWTWFRDSMLSKNQSTKRDYQVLDFGWSSHWVKEKDDFEMPLPEDKWISKFPRKVYPYQNIASGLPLFWKAENLPTHRMWAKCDFKIPEDLEGKQVELYMRGIEYEGVFYVNGQYVTKLHNHDMPAYIDITKFINRKGNNVLAIGITDYIAIRSDDAPKLKDGEHGGGHIVDSGSFLLRNVHIGMQRPPLLILRPDLFVRNIKIDTTLKDGKKIEVATTLFNNTNKLRDVRVIQSIFDQGQKVFELGERELKIGPQKEITFINSEKWNNVVLWDFNKPQLYEVRTEIVEGEELIDKFSERFGFKEWGMKGRNFYLNGNIIHPYGDGYALKNYGYYWPVTPTSSRITRISFNGRQEHWLDVADESGSAGTWEISMSPFGGMGYKLGGDLIYKNLLSKWKKIIPEDRNHPALFCYTLGNEPPTSDDKICEKMFKLEEEIYRLDPSKLAHFSRGNELMGRSKMYSPHYLYQKQILPTDLNSFDKKQDKISEVLKRRLATQHKVGHQYEKTWMYWEKEKPVFDSEGVSVTDGKEFVPWLFGEETFIRRLDDKRRYTLASEVTQDVMRAFLYEGHRKNGISSVLAHIGWRWGDESLTPIAIFMYEDDYRISGGSSSFRLFKVLNDTLKVDDVEVSAILSKIDGTLISQSSDILTIKEGGMTDWKVKIPAIDASKPEYIYLEISAKGKNSGHLYKKKIRMTLFPKKNLNIEPLTGVALFDPSGTTYDIFNKAGFKINKIIDLKSENLQDVDVLIIGRNTISIAEKFSKEVNRRVEEGMRVLFLSQNNLNYQFPFIIEDGDNVANGAGAVISSPTSPIFKGLLPEDFRFWQNRDRVPLLYRNAPFIPSSGNCDSLLYGAKTTYPQELGFAPLFTAKSGKGLFMISQLEIVPSLSWDPVPAILLNNMLKYLKSYKMQNRRFVALVTDSEKIKLKNQYALKFEDSFDKNSLGTLFITKKAFVSKNVDKSMKKFVVNGGTLYLKGLSKKRIGLLKDHFNIDLKLTTYKSGDALMTVRSNLFDGLTQYNWKWDKNFKKPTMLVGEEIISVSNRAVEELLAPAYILKVPFGKGSIILDSAFWGESGLKKSKIITSSILRNLGAEFENVKRVNSGRDWDKVVAKFDFIPIDISQAVNCGFEDDSAGNGKGGWTDEGKGHDIGDFPVGKQEFNKIPFLIAEPNKNSGNGMVALQGHCWGSFPKKSIEIPVKKKLDQIFFIHGCAWASLPAGSEMVRYIIYYADRKDWIPGVPLPYIYVPVKNKRHIYDWWFYDKIASGEYVMPEAFVAWRDKGVKKNRGVAMMEWSNPYPEREIEAICVEATSASSQFFFIGATGAKYKKNSGYDNIKLQKAEKETIPVELQQLKNELWVLKTGKFILYFDASQRIRAVFNKKGECLFTELGYWYVNGYNGDNFKFIAHQTGKFIDEIKAYRQNGSTILEIKNIESKYLYWSQKIIFTGGIIKVINELNFKEDPNKIREGYKANISAFVKLVQKDDMKGKNLLDYGDGFMILPIKNPSVIVKFSDSFKRHKNGVYYINEVARVGISPKSTQEQAKWKYVIEFEVIVK